MRQSLLLVILTREHEPREIPSERASHMVGKWCLHFLVIHNGIHIIKAFRGTVKKNIYFI